MIVDVHGREVLDSRGNPTFEVEVLLESGAEGMAIVPSGASTGTREAVELRDGDPKRSWERRDEGGPHVNRVIAPKLIATMRRSRFLVDRMLIDLDGTENKGKLGRTRSSAPRSRWPGGGGGVRPPVVPVPRRRRRVHPPRPDDEHPERRLHADNNMDIQEFM